MSPDTPFPELMARLRAGDEEAAAVVFNRFARQLVRLAQSQFASGLRPRADAEDIVQSVYRSFFTRQGRGQFHLFDWDSLWGLLTVITVRKCANRLKYLRRECRDLGREVPLEDAGGPEARGWQALAREPSPPEAAILAETVEELMRGLDDRERTMLALSLQGYTVQEVSPQVGRSERTVQRLLERVHKRLSAMQTNTL